MDLKNVLIPSMPLFALPLAVASCQSEKEAHTDEPLNIVYIMTDDHTGQMMSCYDTRYMHTPNLDRIARDGVRFTNSFVANSLSGPSRLRNVLYLQTDTKRGLSQREWPRSAFLIADTSVC